jgi:N-methylhydantoinase B
MVVETAEPAVANTAGDGVVYGACGILGGEDGAPHRYILYSGNAEPRPIRTKETGLVIRPGDRLVLESGGGGGWGDPPKRYAAAQACDTLSGFVSPPPQAGEG